MIKNFNIITKYSENFEFSLKASPDKSLTHRAIIFASLSKGDTLIFDYLNSKDIDVTINFFKNLGVHISKVSANTLFVKSLGYKNFKPQNDNIYFGNSGTSIRLLLGILTGLNFTFNLTGDSSLSKRPMARVLSPLKQMGLTQLNSSNTLPLRVKGTSNVKGISYFSDKGSAQIKSSIMLASLYSKDTVEYIESKLSRDHTENLFKFYNLNIVEDYIKQASSVHKKISLSNNFSIDIPAQNLKISGDFSSTAFFLAIPLLIKNSKVTINNVNLNPLRTGFLDVLLSSGLKVEISNKGKTLNEDSATISISSDQNDIKKFLPINITENIIPTLIDELPLLFAISSKIQGTHIFKGIKELRYKESDRIEASFINLKKLGFDVFQQEDELIIKGNPNHIPKASVLDSFDDHRIAMTYIIYGLSCQNPIKVTNCKNINTSFPDFIDILSNNKNINIKKELIN